MARPTLSDRITEIVRSRGAVSIPTLVDELADDPRARGKLEMVLGDTVLARNVSNDFINAVRSSRDNGRVELLITPGGAFLQVGRHEISRLRMAIAQRVLNSSGIQA